jgi:hypothetical protein
MRASSADRRGRRRGVAQLETGFGHAVLRWWMQLYLEIRATTTTAAPAATARCGRDHSGRVRVTLSIGGDSRGSRRGELRIHDEFLWL